MFKYVPLVAGASLTAAEALTSGNADVAICWDGGRYAHGVTERLFLPVLTLNHWQTSRTEIESVWLLLCRGLHPRYPCMQENPGIASWNCMPTRHVHRSRPALLRRRLPRASLPAHRLVFASLNFLNPSRRAGIFPRILPRRSSRPRCRSFRPVYAVPPPSARRVIKDVRSRVETG